MPILARSQRQDSKPSSWAPESLLLTIMSHFVRTEVPAVVEAALGRQDSEEEARRGKKKQKTCPLLQEVLLDAERSWKPLLRPPYSALRATSSELTAPESSCPLTHLSCAQAKGSLRAGTVSCSPSILTVLLDTEWSPRNSLRWEGGK